MRRMGSAIRVRPAQHVVGAMAIDADGHARVALFLERLAVSAGPIASELVGTNPVDIHLLDVGVAIAAKIGHLGSRGLAAEGQPMVEFRRDVSAGPRIGVFVDERLREVVGVVAAVALGAIERVMHGLLKLSCLLDVARSAGRRFGMRRGGARRDCAGYTDSDTGNQSAGRSTRL